MDPNILAGIFIGFVAWFLLRYLAGGIYTVDQNERAVKTNFGRAERVPGVTTLNDPISAGLDAEEKQRYQYPQVRVIHARRPLLQVALGEDLQGLDCHPDRQHGLRSRRSSGANQSGTIVEAVTKDQLNTGS
jgi:hypothetical protein